MVVGLVCGLVVVAAWLIITFIVLAVSSSRVDRNSELRCDEIASLHVQDLAMVSAELENYGATVDRNCSEDGSFLSISASINPDDLPLEIAGQRYTDSNYEAGVSRCVENVPANGASIRFTLSQGSVRVVAEFVRGKSRCVE
jgi:hypothetical protein